VSNLQCDGHKGGVTRYWTADFIPAWGMFEVVYHQLEQEPVKILVNAQHVKRWAKDWHDFFVPKG
jgi:hypothetical protein